MVKKLLNPFAEMILDKIIRNKRVEVERAKKDFPLGLLSSRIEKTNPPRDFLKAIAPNGNVKIIAEIKRASPSRGELREDFDPIEIAKAYSKGGASALSVLTDRGFFKGDLNHLLDVSKTVETPLLRKDFLVDPYQVYESRFYGADALLLIAAVLDRNTLTELLELTHSLNMNAIVEVHDEEDLEKALLSPSKIIGINNRDLRTFNVSLDVSVRLSRLIPKEMIVIAESGITSGDDIRRLKEEGICVFLIGETFMRAECPGKELENMLNQFRVMG
jgi:indole-3-glycerol phosphate synthase